MKRKHLKFAVLLTLLYSVITANSYRQIQIYFNDRLELIQILQSDLAIDHAEVQRDNSVIVFLGETEYQRLLEYGYRHKVLIDNWQAHYRNRQKISPLAKRSQRSESTQNYGVSRFKFGSMGGFYTFAEIVNELDSMYLNFPNIITEKFSIGQSVEGREIWAVKISDNPNQAEEEAQICLDALLHAREPGGMSTVMYFMYYLLENYNRDPIVTYLVNNREIYFLPCLNPDGYEYNRQTDSLGGGMWRKNRRDNGNGIFGVDLNRNWDLAFHWDEEGSSSSPASETYRGDSAFSEPETCHLAQFVKSKNISTHINYHTYSNMILYPWSYTSEQPPDSTILFEYSRDMSKRNRYDFGNGNAIGYFANGTECDWFYSEQPNKEKIYSFIFEVGRISDGGFWATEDRIIPLAQANVRANIYLCWIATGYAAIAGYNFGQSVFLTGDTVGLEIVVKNRGLTDIDNIQLQIADISGDLHLAEHAFPVKQLADWQSDTVRTAFSITAAPPPTEPIRLSVQTFYNELPMDVDTLSFYVGSPTLVMHDSANVSTASCDYLDSTSTAGWEITNKQYISAPTAYTDSKNSNYSSNSMAIMTLKSPINLSGYPAPRLSFWTRYEIESNWDCGYVQISTDSGASWATLPGKHTIPGSGYGAQKVTNQPVYDGIQTAWIQEDIDLACFSDHSILLRFVLSSDRYNEYDGWYIDDIRIYYYAVENQNALSSEPVSDFRFQLHQNYPNPFNPITTIHYELARPAQVELNLYNLLGTKIVTLLNTRQPSGQHCYSLDINSIQPPLSSGIYWYTIQIERKCQTRKMIILK
jgi:carboxypeptidase T